MLSSVHFRGSLLNRANNRSFPLGTTAGALPGVGFNSLTSCGQFGAGTSDMKAALEMLIAFKIKISLGLFNIPSTHWSFFKLRKHVSDSGLSSVTQLFFFFEVAFNIFPQFDEFKLTMNINVYLFPKKMQVYLVFSWSFHPASHLVLSNLLCPFQQH